MIKTELNRTMRYVDTTFRDFPNIDTSVLYWDTDVKIRINFGDFDMFVHLYYDMITRKLVDDMYSINISFDNSIYSMGKLELNRMFPVLDAEGNSVFLLEVLLKDGERVENINKVKLSEFHKLTLSIPFSEE